MMTNVMAKTCLNQKITKNSNFHDLGNEEERISESECYPKAEFFRKRICPNIYRMFRSVDWTYEMIIVKWHLFIWHVRKLCALTYAPPVQSMEAGPWLSTLFHVNFHANCPAAQVYVLRPRQFIFVLNCRRLSFLQVLQSTER